MTGRPAPPMGQPPPLPPHPPRVHPTAPPAWYGGGGYGAMHYAPHGMHMMAPPPGYAYPPSHNPYWQPESASQSVKVVHEAMHLPRHPPPPPPPRVG
eukprot:4643852-Prymnesium_polylepis.1